ncbi:osteoclast stimulatory transmembrane protein [Pelobates fuscus]|uniref:osteoclast stimulatory transmembrane protein n=1 Tax=Pelobates fuscus TaxID=191477 RepID=UPI002FE4DF1D
MSGYTSEINSSDKRFLGQNYIFKSFIPRIKSVMQDFFLAYSNPVPSNRKQLLILIIECLLLSLTIGLLMYKWFSSYLEYDSQPVIILTIIVVIFQFCLLILVHPIRCVISIILPSIGTKQGRNFLWSASFVAIMFNIIPNIVINLKNVFHTMKCIAQHSSESLLNSTDVFQNIVRDMTGRLTDFKDKVVRLSLSTTTRDMKIDANIDKSIISRQIIKLSENVNEEFTSVESQLKDGVLTCNKVLAVCLGLYLLWNAIWYLQRYLTDLEFDNMYITKQLKILALKKHASGLLPSSSKWLIRSTGVKLSREEICISLVQFLILSLFILLTVLTIVADHIAYQFALAVGAWVSDLPAMPIALQIKYDATVKAFLIIESNIAINQEYLWKMNFAESKCCQRPSPPNVSAIITFGFIYSFLFVMILLQAYAHRLRRKMSALFYPKREEERVSYLLEKIIHKHAVDDMYQTNAPFE